MSRVESDGSAAGARHRARGSAALFPVGLIIVCTVIELVLSAADAGLGGWPRLRLAAYEFGGFWPGLLYGWTPNFPGQAITMFVTYGFLHGGLIHLGVNMFTLYSLGRSIVWRVGNLWFMAIYGFSLLTGALAYGLLTSSLQPMVGASGALFGLAGAIVGWAYADRRALRLGQWPVIRALGYLIGLNVALWWAMNGHLAWQTHLGGFLGGWAMAVVIERAASR